MGVSLYWCVIPNFLVYVESCEDLLQVLFLETEIIGTNSLLFLVIRGKSYIGLSQRPSSLLEGFSPEVYYLNGGCMQSIGEEICLRIHKIARKSKRMGDEGEHGAELRK